MLDTYILDIPMGSYKVFDLDKFKPSVKNLPMFTGYAKFVNNPTTADKNSGIYKPKLTIYKRGIEATLRIEASAGKIINNNNLLEITENDFGKQLKMLQEKVLSMGVRVALSVLEKGIVAGFHPSKNILITGGYLAMSVITELAKVNLTEKMDLSQTKFRNSGHGLQYYAKSHSLVFYDKNYDLTKSENRAFDSDQRMQRMSLFDYLIKKERPEILRMEARLSEKPKMNSVLAELGYKINPIFSDIFKTAVCKDILQYYFNTYVLPSLFVFDLDINPQSLLKRVYKKYPKIRPNAALSLVALQLLCKDDGVRNLRKIIEPMSSLRNWQRIAVQIKSLNELASLNTSHTFIKDIQQSLQRFEPYTLPQSQAAQLPKPAFDPLKYH